MVIFPTQNNHVPLQQIAIPPERAFLIIIIIIIHAGLAMLGIHNITVKLLLIGITPGVCTIILLLILILLLFLSTTIIIMLDMVVSCC